MKAGLNLYSLRNKISTEKGFFETCERLKDMGYSYLQLSGPNHSAEIIAKVSSEILPVKLTHSPLDRILNDTQALVKEHDLFGCDYIGLGSIEPDKIKDYNNALKTIELLEAAALKLKGMGKKFLYHNHNFEFAKYGNGKTFYDLLIENTNELGFILDTYWVQSGGASIVEYVKKLKGRIQCVHLKDFKVEGFTPRFAAIGDGNINFIEVINAMKKAGTKYYFVEQDDAESYENAFAEVEKSINYLKNIEV
jgi:sugar phosphate isomerase/epimerase